MCAASKEFTFMEWNIKRGVYFSAKMNGGFYIRLWRWGYSIALLSAVIQTVDLFGSHDVTLKCDSLWNWSFTGHSHPLCNMSNSEADLWNQFFECLKLVLPIQSCDSLRPGTKHQMTCMCLQRQ